MLTTLSPSAERNKHYEDDPAAMTANGNPAAQLSLNDHRAFEKLIIQISKIHPVTCDVGQPFWFVPYDLHAVIL
jgi:hypothetical protein